MPSADRLIEIFNGARNEPAGAPRERYLSAVCRGDPELKEQIISLLQAHEDAAGFLTPAIPFPTALTTEKPGDLIGRYRLHEMLGEGGCGVVYAAEQEEPVRRQVALKVIKLGMDTGAIVARFEAERQALAMMDHPNIAKVLDAGATEKGRPYFVMELVRGIRITDYCDQSQLSTAKRLDLFIKVCHAIQHAHQKGIIHRDIKPSNILVSRHDGAPAPKVIDFGIAKATVCGLADTAVCGLPHQFIGTPAYMSPEQAEMSGLNIDTRSDIYSLGVLLYELLVGRTPFDARELISSGVDAMRKTIQETEPLRPSVRLTQELATATANARRPPHRRKDLLGAEESSADSRRLRLKEQIVLLRGDLDWIVMKCLEKDPSRRYETANGLAADLQRHLANEPVVARPSSAAYRLQKVISRNKIAFSAALAIVLTLVLGLLTSTSQAVRAIRAEQAAVQEQQKTKEALYAETQTKKQLEQALAREQRSSYFHRITLAHRELQENYLLKAEEFLAECPAAHRGWEWYYLKRLCRAEPVTLPRQLSAWFQKATFSADGRRLASAGEDQNVTVWDAATGEALLVLPDAGEVRSLAFGPIKGGWLATGGTNGTVTIWDTETRRVAMTLRHHTGGTVLDLAFSPDGRLLASAGEDRVVRVWVAHSGDLVHTLIQHERSVTTLAFSPDGQRLATGSLDSTVRIWDAHTGQGIHTLRGHHDPVTGLAFSSDGQRLATASFDSTVKIWDMTTGQAVKTFSGQSVRFNGVAFLDKDRRVAAAGDDKTLKIWDTATEEAVLILRGHAHSLIGLAHSADGQRLATVSQDRTTRIWDANSLDKSPAGQESLTLRGHAGGIWGIAFTEDGTKLATASVDQTVKVWDSQTGGEARSTFHKHLRVVFSVAFSPDGQRLASGSAQLADDEPGYLKVWDVITGQDVLHPRGNDIEAFVAAFSPDNGRWLVTGNLKGNITVWDAATGQAAHTLDARGPQVFGLTFNSDGKRVAALSAEGMVTIHDATRWDETLAIEPVLAFRAHKTPVRGSLGFSPDGDRLVVPGDNNTVNIWDATGAKDRLPAPLLTLRGHSAQVWGAAFSRDGRWVASGSEDNTVKLWDARTGGAPVRSFRGHAAVVTRVAFSPDGRRLASASLDGTAKVWDVPQPNR